MHELLRAQKDDDDDDQMIIAIDLQQTLPCPKLAINRAYYSRKLWLYNFCVYDVKAKIPTMYLWDETQGGRGADDIASCVHKWLIDNANGRKKLRIFADNCAAQNKNKTVVLMALQKIHAKELERVEFVYMVSGHSYLPCDSYFGHIEKKLRGISVISTPEEYAYHIKLSTKDKPKIVRMAVSDFLAFSSIENYCKWKTPVQVKASFQKARQIILTQEYPAGYALKLHYKQETTERNHIKVSLGMASGKGKGRGKGRGRSAKARCDFDLSRVPLMRKYPGDVIIINDIKLRDLEILMPYMDPLGKTWVNELIARQKEAIEEGGLGQSSSQQPTREEENLDDPDNDAMDYEPVRCISHE